MSDQTADEVIIVKYIVEGQEAITRAKEIRANINAIKEELKTLRAQSGMSFKDLAAGMKSVAKTDLQNSINQITNFGKAIKLSAEQTRDLQKAHQEYQSKVGGINTALRELGTSSKSAGIGFLSLAAGIGAAFGISAINMVRNFFRDFINYAQQAIQSGYEFAKGLYQIEVGVNALRRAGTNITFGDVIQQLQRLKSEFGIFATKDLVVGAAAFLNLNRDMGFTREQLFQLQEAVATLAVVNGRAMDEVQKTVALALSSGYTEGLQRLGVSINRVTIAEEAARIGYAKSYMALTEVQRAEATYNLILQKTAVYSKDLLKYQNTLPGQIDTMTASITDLNAKTGETFLSLRLFGKWIEFIIAKLFNLYSKLYEISPFKTFIETIRKVILHWKELKELFDETFIDPIKSAIDSFTNSLDPRLVSAIKSVFNKLKDLGDIISKIPKTVRIYIEFFIPGTNKLFEFGEKINSILNPKVETKIPGVKEVVEPILTDEQIAQAESAGKQLVELQDQYNIDIRDLNAELQKDLIEIKQDGDYKLQQLETEHENKMREIAEKGAEQIAEAEAKYKADIQKTWDDYYNNLAGAAEKHSNNLLKIEEDYQEKLLRLREGFLLDLEGALEERDARQVLRLIRQYNLERKQAKRERDQNYKEEDRAYQEQLHELSRQRDSRLKELANEFKARTEALKLQLQRELDAERAAYKTKAIQQMLENKRDKVEREAKYKEDLDALNLHLQDRVTAIAKGLADDAKVTSEGMQAIIDIMNSYVGPNGISDSIFDYFVGSIQAHIAAALQAAALAINYANYTSFTGQQPVQTPPPTTPTNPPHKKAQGGLELATKPTMAIYGEGGVPELHAFIPLPGGIGSLSSSTSAPMKIPEVTTRNKSGKAQVEILLGAGLEGKIIDQALDTVADIVIRRKLR